MENNSLLNTYCSSQLVLQVEGDSSSLPLEVQGIIDKNIKVYGVDSISPSATIIESTGRYIAPTVDKKKNNLRGD